MDEFKKDKEKKKGPGKVSPSARDYIPKCDEKIEDLNARIKDAQDEGNLKAVRHLKSKKATTKTNKKKKKEIYDLE